MSQLERGVHMACLSSAPEEGFRLSKLPVHVQGLGLHVVHDRCLMLEGVAAG